MSKGTFDIINDMKNRDYKSLGVGEIAHIYNRGNNKEKIFFENQDYKAFLFRLGLALGFSEKELQKEDILAMPYSRIRITNTNKKDFKLHAFCLMPNHFHLMIEQTGNISISNLILKICTSYSKYINKKYNRVGHVFQDQFKSVLMENDPQLMWTSSYINMNPVKDKLVKHPSQYDWSSYNDFTKERNLMIIETDFLLSIFGSNNFEKETLALSMSKVPFDI
jgi:putative transposase